jgi:hypothetical protein
MAGRRHAQNSSQNVDRRLYVQPWHSYPKATYYIWQERQMKMTQAAKARIFAASRRVSACICIVQGLPYFAGQQRLPCGCNNVRMLAMRVLAKESAALNDTLSDLDARTSYPVIWAGIRFGFSTSYWVRQAQ